MSTVIEYLSPPYRHSAELIKVESYNIQIPLPRSGEYVTFQNEGELFKARVSFIEHELDNNIVKVFLSRLD